MTARFGRQASAVGPFLMGPMIIYEGSRRNRFGDILNVMQQKNEFTFVIEDRSIYRPPELRDENTLTITRS